MPACMTQHEWQDLVTLAMVVSQVNEIADFAGTPDGTRTGEHAVDWICCPAWHPDKKCRGWFDNGTGLLVDKNVVEQ
jgi:hypothetical protein